MRLIRDIEKAIRNWDEESSFSLKGVKNLSRADLDVITLYAETISKYGTYDGFLMPPLGNVEKVLSEYNLI